MKRRVLLVSAACIFFAGCAGTLRAPEGAAPPAAPPPPPIPEQVRRCDASSVLESIDRVRGTSPEQLAVELKAAKETHEKSEQACERVRLAALMLLGEPKTKDEGAILRLLDGVVDGADPGGEGIEPLARLLAAALRRQKVYEDQVSDLNRELQDERARSDKLKRKLDALKKIEKIMNEREKK